MSGRRRPRDLRCRIDSRADGRAATPRDERRNRQRRRRLIARRRRGRRPVGRHGRRCRRRPRRAAGTTKMKSCCPPKVTTCRSRKRARPETGAPSSRIPFVLPRSPGTTRRRRRTRSAHASSIRRYRRPQWCSPIRARSSRARRSGNRPPPTRPSCRKISPPRCSPVSSRPRGDARVVFDTTAATTTIVLSGPRPVVASSPIRWSAPSNSPVLRKNPACAMRTVPLHAFADRLYSSYRTASSGWSRAACDAG